MSSTNFAFLAAVHNRLHYYAIGAEALCWIDPPACLGKARQLADWIARRLAQSHNISDRGDLIEVLARLEAQRDIPKSLLRRLDRLRDAGNDALHSHTAVPSPDDAAAALRAAWDACRAYAMHVQAPVPPPTSFVIPPNPARTKEEQQRRIDAAERAAHDAAAENLELRAVLAERPVPVAPDELARRLRELAEATQTPLTFAGLASRRPRPRLSVQELYVYRSFETDDKSRVSGEAFLAELGRVTDDAPRYLVLGSAGAGKTTLCRHLISALARHGRTVLLLRLRALGGSPNDPGSFLDAAAQWIRAQLTLPVSASDVARLLEREPCVVLFDGLDEVTADDPRQQLAERLHAFARNFPRVPVVVTSREQVLRQTPLDASFTPLRLVPFTLDDASMLIGRLFASADLGAPEDARSFVERLAERLGLLELLSTPLTVTLLAFLRAETPTLPATTSGVLEQCVRVWLERWPRETARPTSLLAHGHARVLLERVAQRLVDQAAHGHTLGFGPLVDEIAAMYRHLEPSASAHDAQHVAEAWLEHHLAHVGLLEEDDHGNVYFAHWSLMQHLAACASPAAATAARVADLNHQDLCFLACEIHADDPDYLAKVADSAVTAPAAASSHWLLRFAASGVPFTSEAVVAACRRLVAEHHHELRRLADTGRCSPRLNVDVAIGLFEQQPSYREPVHAWTRDRLRDAHGEELLATVTWAAPILGVEPVMNALSARPDLGTTAADLLPLWPANMIAMAFSPSDRDGSDSYSCASLAAWTARHLSCEHVLRWALALPDGELVAAATAALALDWGPHFEAALATALTARALALGVTRPQTLSELTRDLARHHTHVHARPGRLELLLGFRTPVRPRCTPGRSRPAPADGLVRRLQNALHERFPENPVLSLLPSATPPDATLPALEWSPVHPDADLRDFVADCMKLECLPETMQTLGVCLEPFDVHEVWNRRLVLTPVPSPPEPRPDTSGREPTHLFLFVNDRARGAATFHQRVWSAFYGEAALALFASKGAPDDERRAHLDFRLANRWLLEAWTLLERRWSSANSDTGVALLLALGWSQYVTTATWPATSTWAALVSPRSHDPWLVRAHAHLCWLTRDRRAETSRAGLRRALHDGRRDPALGPVAIAMRHLLAE